MPASDQVALDDEAAWQAANPALHVAVKSLELHGGRWPAALWPVSPWIKMTSAHYDLNLRVVESCRAIQIVDLESWLETDAEIPPPCRLETGPVVRRSWISAARPP